MENKVIVVISECNDLETKSSVIGVFANENAFEEGMKCILTEYIDSHMYSEEDIMTLANKSIDEYINNIINELEYYGEAIDPLDELQVWYYSEKEIQ